jgi:hypothetical protein
MKTLHVYLLREVLATLLMTVAVFTFVLLIGNVLKDILPLLLNRQVGLLTVGKALLLLIPFVLAFSLPMGMLTATLLVFGRFSADQELTAARASGISLLSLASPIVAFSLLLCLLCACINLHIAPVCRVAFNQMRVEIGIERANQGLPEDQFITDFDNTIVYVGKSDTNTLKNVMILLTPDDTNSTLRIHAPRGTYSVDPVTRKVEVHLFEAKSVFVAPGKWAPQYLGEWTYSLTPRGDLLRAQGTKLRNMTFLQSVEQAGWPAGPAHRGIDHSHPGADEPAVVVFLRLLRLHPAGYPARHPCPPARNQHRFCHRPGTRDALLQLPHRRRFAVHPAATAAQPHPLVSQFSLPGRGRRAALAGQPGRVSFREGFNHERTLAPSWVPRGTHFSARKFFTIVRPLSVRMLSG